MKYYAIADLHGRYDLLDKALGTIADHAGNNEHEIITLGDYIDRGKQSKEIIARLMNNETINLKGNHEDMAVQVCSNPTYDHRMWWVGNGGDATLISYGSGAHYHADQYSMNWMDTDHLKWMSNLPLYYETEKHVFVHAGIPNDDDLEKHDPERLMWMLYPKDDHGGWRGKYVVHGHHQFKEGPMEYNHRVDLDTFAWYTGRLVVGVFDDTQYRPIDYIEVKNEL